METTEFLPVLLGADLNCYHVARAFFEEYGIRSHAFGKYETSAIKASRIIHFHAEPNLGDEQTLIRVLDAFAAEHPQKKLILVGCTDDYVKLIIENREKLHPSYLVSYIDAPLMNTLSSKEHFYDLCIKHDISFPKTFIFNADMLKNDHCLAEENLGFPYPIIIKPSVSHLYWKYPFDKMKKVYLAKNETDAKHIVDEIYQAGYPETLIIQDFIPGRDDCMYVLTCYSDQSGKVRMSCLGHVLLEEHTPKGLGNHVAVITEEHPELVATLTAFLESIGYRGFSNFDIKYDSRDNSWRVFEINLRQGRSNYYVTAQGFNVAKLLVSDLITGEFENERLSNSESIFWSAIPKKIVYDYTESAALSLQAKALAKAKKHRSSLWYSKDLCLNPMRLFYVMANNLNHFKKFKKYLSKPNR